MAIITEKEARRALASCAMYDENQLIGTHYIVQTTAWDIYEVQIWCVENCQYKWNSYWTRESRLPDSHPMKMRGFSKGFIFTNWRDAVKFELKFKSLAKRYNSGIN